MALFRKASDVLPDKKSSFRRELGLYTLLYLIFFSVVFLPVILRDGLILGGDGYGMYYPTFVNFRRTLLDFGSSIQNGSFQFPLMNFNYGLGTDNLTALVAFISCPFYYFCVLVPVRYLATFMTVVIFLLDYIAGIAFLRLCSHFGHRTYWNSLMALSYVFSTCFMDDYLYNPHFMYMLIAFPLMVIGIDRVIKKTGWRLLCFCVFWLGISSFTLLIYTLPFLALFAFVRVAFVYKERFVPNLLKAFLRCLPVLITGFLFAAVMQLPVLYLLINSARSVGNPNLNYAKLMIPSLSRMSECFFMIEPTGQRSPLNINPMFIAFPGILLTLLVLKKQRELRVHMLIMIACVSLPLIDYGLNGFQYSLIRWGCAPALVFAYAGTVGISEFAKLDAKQYRRTIGILCFYWITYSSTYFLKYEAGNLCAVLISIAAICRLIPALCRIWHRFSQSAAETLRRFFRLLKGKTPSVKRYLASAAAVIGAVCILLGIVLLIFLPLYTFYPQLLINAGLLSAASAVIIKKREWAFLCCKVLGVLFFASSIFLYSAYHKSSFEAIQTDHLFEMMRDVPVSDGYIGRTVYEITPDASDETDQGETIRDETLNSGVEIKIDDMGLPEMFLIHGQDNRFTTNYSLIYNLPDTETFHNMMDQDLVSFLHRSGMDGFDCLAFTNYTGFRQEEAIYSLFGIQTLGSKQEKAAGFGVQEICSESGDNDTVYHVYNYEYAFPLGVTYDSFMTQESFDALRPSVYPFALLQSAYIEGIGSDSPAANTAPQSDQYRCDAKIEKELIKTNSSGMDNYKYTITLNQDVSECFLYLDFYKTNTQYPSFSRSNTTVVTVDGKECNLIKVMNDNGSWPWIRRTDRYAIPLGYQESSAKKIEFELTMDYEDFGIYAIPASVLTDAYAARCEETLENVQLSMNRIDGDITVSKDKLLSVSMLHNSGWRVFVDGKEAPLCKVNGLFLGVQLSAGTHHVRFTYRTPWLNAGLICSGTGILLWITMELITRRKKKQSGKAA